MPTSTEMEMFASTSTSGPRLIARSEVVFAYGAVGAVAFVLLPQFVTTSVESFASRRGRFMDTKTSAFSLSANSKPTGMLGLKARPRRMSTLVTFVVNGSGVSVESGKPVIALLRMFVRSRRTVEASGIYTV
jgi:hypothetical protein